VDPKACSFDARSRGERGQPLERLQILGAAVRVPGVIERVGTNADVVRAEHLGPRERQREQHRVARRHVRGGDLPGIDLTILWNRERIGQRGPADAREIHGDFEVPPHGQHAGHLPGGFDLAGVTLSVQHRQRAHIEPVARHHRGGRVRIEAAAQEDHCWWHAADLTTASRLGFGTPGLKSRRYND
jgi:hypothetical protein